MRCDRVVYGAGEQGRVLADVLRRAGVRRVVFVDDDRARWGRRVVRGDDEPEIGRVVGGRETLAGLGADGGTPAVGDGSVRLELTDRLADAGIEPTRAVDPAATVAETASVEPAATVTAESYVGPDATIGRAALVDGTVTIAHDTRLAPGVTVAPGATVAGGCRLDRGAFVGAGATIRDHTVVGREAVVGCGAVVTSDVPADTTVVGVPAEPL